MANNISFQAQGKTYKANATTVSQTITVTPDGPCNQLMVFSHEASSSSKAVYFTVSNKSDVTVTVPAAGTPSYALIAIPNTAKAFTVPFQFSPSAPLYIAFITESATAECYFTPGEGF